MAQTSVKRRNTLIASIVIVVLAVASVAFLIGVYEANKSTLLSPSISLNQSTVIQGSNLQAQVNVTTSGKAENVTLSSNSGSSGLNCTFQPSIGKSNFTSTLTIHVPDSTPTGNYSVTVIASGDGQEENASLVVPVLSANVTVLGRASSAALAVGFTSIQKIEFTDIQTGFVTSFKFPFTEQSYNPFGNYSVTLKNEHTYDVTISYYLGLSIPAIIHPASDYIETFTVNATVGQTAITEDFG